MEIEDREDGEKTIVFSQFTSMLDLIQPFLDHHGIKYARCECMLLYPIQPG
jgi:SNF2 family DNA or RNA helicase